MKRPTTQDRLAAADHSLQGAMLVLRRNPTANGLRAEELVYEARRAVVGLPEVIRVFEEGGDEEEFHTFERVVRVQAFRLTERAIVITPKGPITAEPGEWVARDREGGLYTVSEVVFQAEGCRQID